MSILCNTSKPWVLPQKCVPSVYVCVYAHERPSPSAHPASLFASTPTRHRQFLFSPLTGLCSQSEPSQITLLCQWSWVADTATVTTDTTSFIVAKKWKRKSANRWCFVFHRGFFCRGSVLIKIHIMRLLWQSSVVLVNLRNKIIICCCFYIIVYRTGNYWIEFNNVTLFSRQTAFLYFTPILVGINIV